MTKLQPIETSTQSEKVETQPQQSTSKPSVFQITQPNTQYFQQIEHGAQILQPSQSNPYTGSFQANTVFSNIRPPSKDYLAWSIFNCLCCCWIYGLYALYYSSRVRQLNLISSPQAEDYSRATFRANLAGTLLGIVLLTILIIFYALHQSYSI